MNEGLRRPSRRDLRLGLRRQQEEGEEAGPAGLEHPRGLGEVVPDLVADEMGEERGREGEVE